MLAYLARYTHRVAISNARLIGEAGVTFKWKDYRIKGRDRLRIMTLDAAEFIRRCQRRIPAVTPAQTYEPEVPVEVREWKRRARPPPARKGMNSIMSRKRTNGNDSCLPAPYVSVSLCERQRRTAPEVPQMAHMRRGRRAAEFHLAQGERERDGQEGKHHQDPEHVDIGEVGRLRLHLLANPRDGLLLRLGRQTALREKILRRLFMINAPLLAPFSVGGAEAGADAMLVACRLAGLSALEAYYEGVNARTQSDACGSGTSRLGRDARAAPCVRSWRASPA